MNLSDELQWRGFLNQTTYKDLSALNRDPITFYFGVDPSADSMTIGNLAAAMVVKTFIKHGHKAVLLIGGATGLIGDPDGKSEERTLKSREDVNKNKNGIAAQYQRIFKGSDFEVVDNYDWFKDFNYLDFLRDAGKHVPMRQMLGREFVESRLGEDGAGISYAEFSYVLIQAYDFLWLNENKNVTLQLAGSDQWGNSIAGVDLIRRKNGNEAHVFSAPLVIDQVTGKKFGKSEDGAIWLDSDKTSPTKFYQFWINVNDQQVESFLRIYTEFGKEEVESIMKSHNEDPSARIAQIELAKAVTLLIHGVAYTEFAEEVTALLTGRKKLDAMSDPAFISNLKAEIPFVKVNNGAELAQILVDTGLTTSKTEARKLIAGNAISLNGNKTEKEIIEESDFNSGFLIVRRGKAFKDSALVELI
jgi:tyrosyl-tRNA synthetase